MCTCVSVRTSVCDRVGERGNVWARVGIWIITGVKGVFICFTDDDDDINNSNVVVDDDG